MAANAKECEDRNRVIKEEREIMLSHFQELKGQMNKLREAARAELLTLTLQSNAAIKELKRVTDKVKEPADMIQCIWTRQSVCMLTVT